MHEFRADDLLRQNFTVERWMIYLMTRHSEEWTKQSLETMTEWETYFNPEEFINKILIL